MTEPVPTAAVAVPTTVDEATLLLEEFATLEGQLAKGEEYRAHLIATANARCDERANPLIARRGELAAALQTWWAGAAAALTGGKRKSIELGGCMIGSKAGRASLAVVGDEAAIATKLSRRKWAVGLFRVTVAMDKAALLKALAGVHGRKLKALGLGRKDGAETFILERAEQAGTRAANG